MKIKKFESTLLTPGPASDLDIYTPRSVSNQPGGDNIRDINTEIIEDDYFKEPRDKKRKKILKRFKDIKETINWDDEFEIQEEFPMREMTIDNYKYFKLGDEFYILKNNKKYKGVVIHILDENIIGVQMEKYILGHDCRGYGNIYGNCWYLQFNYDFNKVKDNL